MASEHKFRVRDACWQDDAAKLMRVREQVFVDEQKVPPDLEWDDLDPSCLHVVVETSDGKPIATGRLSLDGRIGRMAVLREWRGKGAGSAVLNALLTQAQSQGLVSVYLHAQMHAQPFYARHGFEIIGAPFEEAGILHIEMIRRVPAES